MESSSHNVILRFENGNSLKISLLDGSVTGLKELLPTLTRATASQVANSLIVTGEGLEKFENYEAAENVYAVAHEVSEHVGDHLNAAASLICEGLASKRRGDLGRSLDLYQRAVRSLEVPEENPDRENARRQHLATAWSNTALLYQRMNKLIEAERAAIWVIELLQDYDDKTSRSKVRQSQLLIEEIKRKRKQP